MRIFLLGAILWTSLLANAQSNFIISAHRGNSSEAPENTISAFQSAIDVGADYFECDVRKTKDNVLVTLHDATLNRTTNATGRLRDRNFSQLANVDAGYASRFGNQFAGERIPKLRDVLRLARGKIKVEIEIKEDGLVDEIVAMVEDLGMVNQVSIISFDRSELSRSKQLNSQIATKYLLGPIWWTRQMNQARDIGAEYIGPNGVASARRVRQAQDRGVGIISYTINADDDIRRAINNGQAGIATDVPRRAIQIRNEARRGVAPLETSEEVAASEPFQGPVFYPNPVTEAFYLNPLMKGEVQVSIHSLTGKTLHRFTKVRPQESKLIRLPEGLQAGLYFIRIVGNRSSTHYERFIVR